MVERENEPEICKGIPIAPVKALRRLVESDSRIQRRVLPTDIIWAPGKPAVRRQGFEKYQVAQMSYEEIWKIWREQGLDDMDWPVLIPKPTGAPPPPPSCYHDWRKYVGFTEVYEFCALCDCKRAVAK